MYAKGFTPLSPRDDEINVDAYEVDIFRKRGSSRKVSDRERKKIGLVIMIDEDSRREVVLGRLHH